MVDLWINFTTQFEYIWWSTNSLGWWRTRFLIPPFVLWIIPIIIWIELLDNLFVFSMSAFLIWILHILHLYLMVQLISCFHIGINLVLAAILLMIRYAIFIQIFIFVNDVGIWWQIIVLLAIAEVICIYCVHLLSHFITFIYFV